MIDFKELEKVNSTKEVIKDVFGVDLDIDGGWGYNASTAVIINSLSMPIEQFLNLFATVRANIEMNLTLEKDDRYGGINISIEKHIQTKIDDVTYDVVTCNIKAMKEDIYAKFIKEYKDGYGKKEFDLSGHFNKRKDSTILRVVEFWFDGLKES